MRAGTRYGPLASAAGEGQRGRLAVERPLWDPVVNKGGVDWSPEDLARDGSIVDLDVGLKYVTYGFSSGNKTFPAYEVAAGRVVLAVAIASCSGQNYSGASISGGGVTWTSAASAMRDYGGPNGMATFVWWTFCPVATTISGVTFSPGFTGSADTTLVICSAAGSTAVGMGATATDTTSPVNVSLTSGANSSLLLSFSNAVKNSGSFTLSGSNELTFQETSVQGSGTTQGGARYTGNPTAGTYTLGFTDAVNHATVGVEIKKGSGNYYDDWCSEAATGADALEEDKNGVVDVVYIDTQSATSENQATASVTGNFTFTANRTVVVVAGFDAATGGSFTQASLSFSDTAGWTWTKRVESWGRDGGTGSYVWGVAIWTAETGSGGANSITVSVPVSGGNADAVLTARQFWRLKQFGSTLSSIEEVNLGDAAQISNTPGSGEQVIGGFVSYPGSSQTPATGNTNDYSRLTSPLGVQFYSLRQTSGTLFGYTTLTNGRWSLIGIIAKPTITSGTVYNDNLTEASTAAETLAQIMTMASSLSEAATAADALAQLMTMVNAFTESSSASDSVTGGMLFAESLPEASSAADSLAHAQTMPNALSEGASGNDSLSTLMTMVNALSEGSSASDTLAHIMTMVNALTESSNAQDSLVGGMLFVNALSEGSSANDSVTAGYIANATLTEASTAADSLSSTGTFNVALTENGSAADTVTALGIWNNAITESSTAADSLSAGLQMAAVLSEGSSAADSLVTAAVFVEAFTEASTAADSLPAGLLMYSVLSEPSTAADALVDEYLPGGSHIYNESITESVFASDFLYVPGGKLVWRVGPPWWKRLRSV